MTRVKRTKPPTPSQRLIAHNSGYRGTTASFQAANEAFCMPSGMPMTTAATANAICTVFDRQRNAAARLNGTTYSRLIAGMRKHQIINRKMLADLAVHDSKLSPPLFKPLA